MSTKNYDPILQTIFDEINKKAFDGILRKPDKLVFNYNLRTSGGRFRHYRKRDARVWIEVKGTLKDNSKAVYETMAHEMAHQSMYQKWYDHFRNLDLITFYDDKSSMFIVELTRVAIRLGYTYNELAYWDSLKDDNPQAHVNQSAYEGGLEINDMLGDGFFDD